MIVIMFGIFYSGKNNKDWRNFRVLSLYVRYVLVFYGYEI